MFSLARRASLGLFLLCPLSTFAASSSIGLAVANGSFQVDRASVRSSATLFDGTVIETNLASSELQLTSGVRLRLAADSRARVYESYMVLEKGIGQLESPNYRVEANSLRVAAGQGSTARVQIAGPNQIVVAAHTGRVLVSNNQGVLVARLNPGREMSFEPQAAAAQTTRVSGILALKNGKFILVDRVTNVTMELQGTGLEAEVGKLVEITGTVSSAKPTVAGASQVIEVSKITLLVKSGAAAGAAGGAAGGAGAAAGAAGGLSTGAIVAIVGGVAAAGTIGGLAAAHALPGQGGGPPSVSR